MGSLIWVLNLWSMKIAAGAVALVAIGAIIQLAPLFEQAQETRDQVVAAADAQKAEAAEVFDLL